MYILLSIAIIAAGAVMLAKPEFFFTWTESWKSNTAGEPSDFYLFSTRLGGALCLLVGAAALIILLFVG